MARFELYLIARPLRWVPTLEAIVGSAAGSERRRLEDFIAGTVEGPVLLVASDDRAVIDTHWDRCHLERLAVLIVDRSTLWDRLRDRFLRGPVAPSRPVPASAAPPPDVHFAVAPDLRAERLAGMTGFGLSPRARATLMAACVFLAMLGLALLVMPHSSGTSDAPMGASPEMGDRRDSSGATPQVAPGTSGGASPSRATGVEGSEGRTRPTARGGCAGSPSTDASTTPGALMFAFVLGVALAWGAGYLVERRGAHLSSENLRAGRQIATFLAALVAVFSVLVRLSAVSAAREVAPPPDAPAELAEEEDAAVPPDALEAAGPFARFLRRRRTTHGAPSFHALLDQWRTSRADGGTGESDVTASDDVPAHEDVIDAGAAPHERRHHREHRSHHRRDAGGDVAPLDAAPDDARSTPNDALSVAGSAAALPSSPQASPPPDVPRPVGAGDGTTPPPPRAAARTVRARRRREPPPPPPPPPRAPVSPLTTFAAGLVAGLVLSPRWRAIARGER
jgi:hypothetical protein